MSQGSINMPQPGRSPIEGIMQALQAVHAYYGIDTQKAQQKLLESQTKVEDQKAAQGAMEASMLKSFMDKKGMGAPTAEAAPAADLGAPTDSSRAPAVMPPATATPLVTAARGNQAAAPPKLTPEDLANPVVAKFFEPSLAAQGKLLGNQKSEQDIGFAKNEEARKQRSEIGSLQKDFYETFNGVKDADKDLTAAKDVSKMILSGNKFAGKAAEEKLALVAAGITRLSPEALKTVEAQDTKSRVLNFLSKKGTGLATPEERRDLHEMAALVASNAAGTIDSAANTYSQLKAPSLGIDPGSFKTKYILPQGADKGLPETKVLPDLKSGKPALFYKQGKKWLPSGGNGE